MERRLWIGAGVAAVAVLGGSAYALYRVVTVFFDRGVAANELPEAARSYRATGLPFVAADIAPPHPAPERDATPAIRLALKAAPKGEIPAKLAKAARDPGPTADPVVAPFSRSLALIGAAVERPQVDFRRDWDLGPNVLFPEFAGMKVLARAAAVRAVRSAQKGDDAAAIRDLRLSRQIAVWAGSEPTLIAMLVRIAIEAIAIDGAQRCLAAAHGDAARIAHYAAWLDEARPFPVSASPYAARPGWRWPPVGTSTGWARIRKRSIAPLRPS